MQNEQRSDYGFERTVCGCGKCKDSCYYMPGMLSPADVARLAEHFGYGTNEEAQLRFGFDHLAASPGALVVGNGQVFRIRILVPKMNQLGDCHWLDKKGNCTIHAVAPYGCAFFDAHMPSEEGTTRSTPCLEEILNADREGLSTYTVLWQVLNSIGQVAKAPEVARGLVKDAIVAM